MRATAIAVCLLAAALAGPPAAGAQQAGRPASRIGVLTAAWAPNHPAVEGLRAGLKALGLEEGRQVTWDIRFTEGNLRALPGAAAALVTAGADVLFTSAENATLAAAAVTQRIPIVFVSVGDPVASGVVSSVARPGRNVTGVSNLATELAPKRLEILKALVPGLRRVWAVYDAADAPEASAAVEKARAAAASLKLEVLVRPVRTPEELAATLAAVRPGDGFFAPDRATSLDISAQILKTAAVARTPTMFSAAFWVGHGALASYGADYHAAGYQAARLVARILQGARPQDLPVEGANRIELVINLKTAKALGLAIPQPLLLRADRVIQ